MYHPGKLSQQTFYLSESVAYATSQAEYAVIKAEHAILNDPYAPSLRKTLALLEAIAATRVEGHRVSLHDCVRLQALLHFNSAYEDTNELLRRLLAEDGLSETSGAIETLRYLQTTEWISHAMRRETKLDPKMICEIHLRAHDGPSKRASVSRLRQDSYTPRLGKREFNYYKPPDPDDLYDFVDDLCEFINSDKLTAVSQAAVSHFQLEAIKAFDKGMDRTGRMLSHTVFFKREVANSLILPLALYPAMRTLDYTRSLLPYHEGITEQVDIQHVLLQLIHYCAVATEALVRVISLHHETMKHIVEGWRCNLGKVEHGSAVEQLLYVLPGSPILTVQQASELIGRCFSTTNSALNKLKAAGIVSLAEPISRNKVYMATEVIERFERLNQQVIKSNPGSRDHVLSEIISQQDAKVVLQI